MKRGWLTLVLALVMLCKCQAEPRMESAPSDHIPSETKPTESVGFCEPETLPETILSDSLRVYPLGTDSASGIAFCGPDILLFSGDEKTMLTLLSGNMAVKAETSLSCPVSADDAGVVVTDHGVTYADRNTCQLVFLDRMLTEIRRIPLPADCSTMALSADGLLLYYCTPEALRVLDLETGLDRLIRQMQFPVQNLTGLHGNDTIMQCAVTNSAGYSSTLFLSAENGALLYEAHEETSLQTHGDLYFTTRMDGGYLELISGSAHFGPSILVPPQDFDGILPVLSRHSLVLYSYHDNATLLDYYDLQSGTRPSRAEFPDFIIPRSIQPDPEDNTLWFLYFDRNSQQDMLCAWDLDRSASGDEAQYLQNRWNQRAPDLEGLAQCQALADEISVRHGVRILLWTEAVQILPHDHTLVPEYQVPLIQKRLYELNEILSRYPDGFLEEAASGTSGGLINICLVREISDGVESPASLQFWDRDADTYVALTVGSDVGSHIHRDLFYIINSHVLGNCKVYDDWNSLNPKRFRYGSDSWSEEWLSEGNRYFVDQQSMDSPLEDRARIMECAMTPGQEDIFQSQPMQAKLRKLCLGIRKAFRLESGTYPWEQYLATPLP